MAPSPEMQRLHRVVRSSRAAIVGAFLAVACQGYDQVTSDGPYDLMGDGLSNKTFLGGYWWTFVDRSGRSEVEPYVGKVDPNDTVTRPLQLTGTLRDGDGIEGGLYHVKGRVTPLPVVGDRMAVDRYWDAVYGPVGSQLPGFCGIGGCRTVMTPGAGIGFGFKSRNTPLESHSIGTVGISFKAKLGPSHATGKPIAVTIPLDLTDVPDPTLEDRFGSYYTVLSDLTQSSDTNAPLCKFPGSALDDLTIYETKRLSCFADLTTRGHSVLEVGTEMKTFCVDWAHFGPPLGYEAEYEGIDPYGPVTTQTLIAHAVKLQFQAYQPSSDEGPDSVAFDFYVDDVYLLETATWDLHCKQPGVVIPPLL